jgi:hypothetical protein
MTDATRRAVAYIAARMAGRRDAGSVYDFSAGRHFHFSGQVEPGSVQVYDYDSRCHISGSPSSLYHFGNQRHLSLTLSGSSFSGYDFSSRAHFNGSVSGSSVSVYDFDVGQHFQYAV